MRAAVPFLSAFLAPGCARAEPAVQAAGTLAFRGLVPAEARVSAYAFEGAGRVPWSRAEAPPAIPHGELGWTPATRLYLGFEDLEAELGRGLADGALTLRAGRAGSGRFGRGLELDPGGELALTLGAADAGAPAHTLQFAWKPRALEPGELVVAPGAFTLALGADGKLRLELTPGAGGEPLVVTSARPLAAERWNHVAFVLDREDLRSARLVVDGVPSGRPLGDGARPGPWNGLRVRATAAAALDELRLEVRAANTAELERHARPRPRTREHLTLELDEGPRTFELWSAFESEPVVAAEGAWAHAVLEHVVFADGALAWTPAQWRELRPLDPPLARTTHPVVTLGGGRLFTFSGETRDSHLGPMRNTRDTWLFDLAAERWERVEGVPAPPGRCHQPAAYSPEHDLVLLCGGWANDQPEKTVLADAWVFHVAEKRWERRADPPARLSDSVVVWHAAARRFVVLSVGRAWTYEPGLDRWDELGAPQAVDVRGAPVRYTPGGSVSAAYEPVSGRTFLFGGERGNAAERFVDECAWYELETNRYVRFEPPVRPAARVRAAMAHDPRSGRLLLYGGVRDKDSVRFDDLWSLDPVALTFEQHLAAGAPSRRGGYFGLGHDAARERFVLLCGRHDHERFLEEAWALRFDEGARGGVRLAFDRAGWAGGERWFAEVEHGALEALTFRTSADGVVFGPPAAEPGPERFVEVRFELAPRSPARVRAVGFR